MLWPNQVFKLGVRLTHIIETKQNFLIFGASKGLGKAMVQSFCSAENQIYTVSRTAPIAMRGVHWIEADLSYSMPSVERIKAVIDHQKIDVLIYNLGLWETTAFTERYDFEKISSVEIQQMISVNITSCIKSIQALLPNLRASAHAKVILIGSTWGVENHKAKELVFSASKFALRGIAESLREVVREDLIGVSVLNLGYLATDYCLDMPIDQLLEETEYRLIPLADVIQAIKFILSTSKGSCVKEILMPAMQDTNV